MFILLTSPASTTGVHALSVAPPSRIHCKNMVPNCASSLRSSTPASASLSSSVLFGNRNGRYAKNQLRSTSNDSSNAMDAEITTSTSSSSSTFFLRAVDNFGMKLKPWALAAYDKRLKYSNNNDDTDGNETDTSVDATKKEQRVNKAKNILCRLQANLLWVSYIFYRGYRGFFVILPAVFREVYRQLEESNLVVDVYGDEEEDEKEYAVNENAEQQQPEQKEPMRVRTRLTITILSMMLTLSYVVSGALRVLGKFIKTFTNTTSVESSFEAAAEEVAVNEDKLRNKVGISSGIEE